MFVLSPQLEQACSDLVYHGLICGVEDADKKQPLYSYPPTILRYLVRGNQRRRLEILHAFRKKALSSPRNSKSNDPFHFFLHHPLFEKRVVGLILDFEFPLHQLQKLCHDDTQADD